MGYIQKFYTRETSSPCDLSDLLRLSLNLLTQPVKEISGYHKRLVNRPYLDEDELAEWLPYLNNTLQGIMFRHYFRPEAVGTENIPDEGAMLVSNHSGMWAWDGFAVCYSVFKKTCRTVTGMSHNIFDGSDLTKTLGLVTGTRKNAIDHLEDERLILVCPGGEEEAVKPLKDRYRIMRTGGFARYNYGYLLAALEAKRPIVPVGVKGAEETHIIFGNIKPQLNNLVDRVYSSLPKGMKKKAEPYKERWDCAKVFPLMLNLIPFPSKIQVRIGRPIGLHRFYPNFDTAQYDELNKKRKAGRLTRDEDARFMMMERVLYSLNEEVIGNIEDLLKQTHPCRTTGNLHLYT
ncbi:1-acyl-sn-glycerol-3-phosphate acyltransferase [Nanoarchaeota archaeon]